jgi:DNA polymerase-3 subunit epsilon
VLVDPQEPIPERVTELTGISDADVAHDDAFIGHADTLRRMIQDADLAAYNGLRYDIPLLKAEYERIGMDLPNLDDRVIVDPYALEKALVSRSLSAMYERYTGEMLEDAHTAMADVRAASSILQEQVRAHIGDSVTPAELADLARGDYLDDDRKRKETDRGVEVCFGKHRGKTLQWVADNDRDYLTWMYTEIDALRPHIDAHLNL